jgi:hypothetical protein
MFEMRLVEELSEETRYKRRRERGSRTEEATIGEQRRAKIKVDQRRRKGDGRGIKRIERLPTAAALHFSFFVGSHSHVDTISL